LIWVWFPEENARFEYSTSTEDSSEIVVALILAGSTSFWNGLGLENINEARSR
jgi:hypothetical protein